MRETVRDRAREGVGGKRKETEKDMCTGTAWLSFGALDWMLSEQCLRETETGSPCTQGILGLQGRGRCLTDAWPCGRPI